MKQGTTLPLLAISMAAAALAGEPHVRREGAFWVEVVQATETLPAGAKLRVTTVGAVTVKGAPGNELSYTLTKRVKARNEGEARQLLESLLLRTARRGMVTVLSVQSVAGLDADLEVTAPQKSREIVIETLGGAVEASQFDGAIHAQTGGGRVSLDQISGAVVAKTAGGDIVLGRMGGSVRCVSGGGVIRADRIRGEAFFETAGGDITVQEVDGPIRCSTNGGGIHIAQAGNLVIADTAGGPIEVGDAKGMVTAKNSGGPIQVGSASEARCESAGGAIRLTSISGSLKATTAVGSIIARFQSQPVAESFLSTGAGDITLWIPSNLKVTVMARNATYGGARRIVSDFPAIAVKSAGAAVIAEGTLNGGGPLVRISGSGGTIFIRRQEK